MLTALGFRGAGVGSDTTEGRTREWCKNEVEMMGCEGMCVKDQDKANRGRAEVKNESVCLWPYRTQKSLRFVCKYI